MTVIVISIGFIMWPGFMSPDSFDQFVQAVSGQYQDWHPPIMSFLWSVLLLILPNQTGILIFHMLLEWCALWILIGGVESVIAQWLFVLLPLFPWIFGITGVIWKDVGMAFSLLLSIAIMRRKSSVWLALPTIILLIYALCVRTNAVFAVAPLVYWWCKQYIRSSARVTFIQTVLILGIMLIGNQQFTSEISQSRSVAKTQWLWQLAMDVGYASLRSGDTTLLSISRQNLRECFFREDGSFIRSINNTIPCIRNASIKVTGNDLWYPISQWPTIKIAGFYAENWLSVVVLHGKYLSGFMMGGPAEAWFPDGTWADGQEVLDGRFPSSIDPAYSFLFFGRSVFKGSKYQGKSSGSDTVDDQWNNMYIQEWKKNVVNTFMITGVTLGGVMFRPVFTLVIASCILINKWRLSGTRSVMYFDREMYGAVTISAILYALSYGVATVLVPSHRYAFWISLAVTTLIIWEVDCQVVAGSWRHLGRRVVSVGRRLHLPIVLIDVIVGALVFYIFAGQAREMVLLLVGFHFIFTRILDVQTVLRINTRFYGVIEVIRNWMITCVAIMGIIIVIPDPGLVLGLRPGLVVIAGAALIVAWRIGYAVGPQREVLPSRYVIVGTRSQAEVISNELERDFGPGHVVVGFWDVSPEVPPAGCQVDCPAGAGSLGSLVGFESLSAAGAFVDIAAVVIPAGSPLSPEIHSMVFAAAEAGLSVVSMSELREAVSGRVALADASTQVTTLIVGAGRGWGYRVASRARDLFVAFIGLVIMAMLVPIVAVLMRLEGPGPLFVGEERIGRWGRPVTLWRFRTASSVDGAMVGPGDIQRDAVGSTQIGQVLRTWRLDGLPQVWNVLEGVLSLVGPRPDQAGFVAAEEVAETLYRARLSVAPGITGWAQVHSRGALVEPVAVASLEYDLYYLRHRSMYLDSVVILETLFAPDRWRR